MNNLDFKKNDDRKKIMEKKIIRLNISQFELTKLLYSSGILAECNLTPSAKLFLWALCSHYNPANKTMFPSQQTVAAKLGISEKSAQRAVKELKTLGLIDYETKKVNHYVFGPKFFELVKMSEYVGQNVLEEVGQNVPLTNKKEKKEQNDASSFEGKGGNKTAKKYQEKNCKQKNEENSNKRVPNSEETKKFLEEREKTCAMSVNPKSFNEEEALKWLQNVPKFWIVKSKVAEFLVEKYKFSEFQYLLKNDENIPVSNYASNNNYNSKKL